MTLRDVWDRYVWPPRPRDKQPIVALAELLDRASERYAEWQDRQIMWLSQRNAELTQQAIDAHKQHGAPVQPPAPAWEHAALAPEILRAIEEKAGSRYEKTALGRDLLSYAVSASRTNLSTADIVARIEMGAGGWN